jgi:hypothetical protein
MGIFDAVRAFLDPSSSEPERESPFAQYRYPYLVVHVPPGKRAPRYCVISAADGVEGFKKIFPYASAGEIASVISAFEFNGVPAIRVLTAH